MRIAVLPCALLALGACHSVYVTRGPGWTMRKPVMHLVFQGDGWDDAEVATYVTHWNTLMNDPGHVLDRLAEYGVVGGVFDTTVYRSQLPIGDAIAAGQAPTPSEDTIYAVMMRVPGALSTSRHDAAMYQGTPYASLSLFVTPYRSANDVLLSHELYEAATDPTKQGYYDHGTGQEIGDVCEKQEVVIDGITVQKVWSQVAGNCE
jgi:hypothetical protein